MTTRTTKGVAGIPALLLIFSLFVAIGTGVAAATAAAPSVSVDPVSTTGYCPGDTFFVTVEANSDTHNLQTLKSDLVYNPAVFEVLGVTDDGLLGVKDTDYLVAPGSGDDGNGRIQYGVSKIGTATSPANGDFITVEFRIKAGAPDNTYPLDLQDVEMKDEGFTVVLDAGTDGNVILACGGTAPTVKVSPALTTGCPGDIFFVAVEANSDTHNLQTLKSDLVYNPAVFEVLGVTDDGLLGVKDTDYLVAPGSGDDGNGRIQYGVSKIGTATSPANGDFITVEFRIKAGAPDNTYPLDLQDVEMKDEGFTVVLDAGTDGTVEVSSLNTYYRDADVDGYGNPDDTIEAESAPAGYVEDNTDCDDTDGAVNPGATEVCDDQIDNDCDGSTDCDDSDCIVDADGDGYDAEPCGNDCDDDNAAVNPGATEVKNGIDDNCDGQIDEGFCECDFCLELEAGLNFVSIPKTLVDSPKNATTIFDVDYYSGECCLYYDALAGSFDLDADVKPCRGFLVYKTAAKTVCVDFDDTASPPSQQLYVGWNTIGYPRTVALSIPDFASGTGLKDNDGNELFRLMATYTPGTGWTDYPFGSLTEATPGAGYWIYMNQNVEMSGGFE